LRIFSLAPGLDSQCCVLSVLGAPVGDWPCIPRLCRPAWAWVDSGGG
jgi:hypothetical protein